MSLFSRLAEKSWLSPGTDGYQDPAGYRPTAVAVGLYIYFGVVVVIFSLIVAAYLMRMGLHEALGHVSDWRTMPEPPLLWINTGILIVSSLAWETARRASLAGRFERMRAGTIAGGFLGLAFLLAQLLLWRQYMAAGYYLSANPANAFFYFLTAVHGLHLAGGLVACGSIVGGSGDPGRTSRNVRLCAIYWHFLLLIWVLLAALLLST
ncbi:MAG: heme-copper oxidase subunit III [Alphaproteobacteria bacterium]|nr:heme-copper oxidase subunit III [Alphaproteobacteria bacterium]